LFETFNLGGSGLIFAGAPMARYHGGTARVTTAPAATMAPSPTSIFDKKVEFAPIDAPLRIIYNFF